jgi:hypothetical protein
VGGKDSCLKTLTRKLEMKKFNLRKKLNTKGLFERTIFVFSNKPFFVSGKKSGAL